MPEELHRSLADGSKTLPTPLHYGGSQRIVSVLIGFLKQVSSPLDRQVTEVLRFNGVERGNLAMLLPPRCVHYASGEAKSGEPREPRYSIVYL